MTGWWARQSLRARLVAVGLVGLAVAQVVGSVTLYVALSVASRHDLDRRARATAQQVVDLVSAGRLPDPIPVTGTDSVQVVDARGRVVSASANGDRLTPLLSRQELALAEHAPVSVPGSRLGMSSTLRVIAVPAASPGAAAGPSVVVVAEPVADLAQSQHRLVDTLLVTDPLLLLALGLIAFWVIGRALEPVEALRSAAERVSGSEHDERLPVPESRDEIHALAVTLNSMLARLGAARDRERSFVADVAHELRNPLASLRVQVAVAARHGATPAELADLAADLERLSTLVDDLLSLARLDAGERLPAPASRAVPAEVLSAVAESARPPGGRDVPVVVGEVADGTLPMTPLELERVLGNLVDNACRHARSRVDVAFRRTPRRAVVSVADDGAGVPASERERVFARFARLEEARDRDSGGTGLGLAIARELVRHRGGDVVLGEAPAGGLLAEVVFEEGQAAVRPEEGRPSGA